MHLILPKAVLPFLFLANINQAAIDIRKSPPLHTQCTEGRVDLRSYSFFLNEDHSPSENELEEYWGDVTLTPGNNVLHAGDDQVIYRLTVNNPITHEGIIDCSGLGQGDATGRFCIENIILSDSDILIFTGMVFNYPPIMIGGSVGRDILKRIAWRSNYGGLYTTNWRLDDEGHLWMSKGDNSFTRPPIPEPATYGAGVSVCALGLAFWRKRRHKKAALL